jgi:hypothetical protein
MYETLGKQCKYSIVYVHLVGKLKIQTQDNLTNASHLRLDITHTQDTFNTTQRIRKPTQYQFTQRKHCQKFVLY